jgi:tripartite-type tricarboxylate transporter receptor subunit TctC
MNCSLPFHQLVRPLSRWLIVAVVTFSGCAAPEEGEYPNRPITLIVPFAPGGASDTFARIIKEAVDKEGLLPQPLVVRNVKGAGATIGSRRVMDAKPDGYTVLLLHDAIITAKYAGTVDYGPEEFTPIAGTGEMGLVIAVRDDSPHDSLDDLMAAATQAPDTIKCAANLGAPSHFVGLLLEKAHPGAKFRYVQYGGGTERFAAIKGGHVEMTAFSLDEFTRFAPGGLKALAVLSDEPHPALPDVPTAGSVTRDVMQYWWVPKGTPPERVELLARALERAMQSDFVRAKLKETHMTPVFIEGDELTARLKSVEEDIEQVDLLATLSLPNLPAIVIASVLLLAGVVTFQEVRRVGWALPTKTIATVNNTKNTARTTIVCLLLTAIYVATLGAGVTELGIATGVFIFAVGATLSRGRGRMLLLVLAAAIVVAVVFHVVFTRVFVIDLP